MDIRLMAFDLDGTLLGSDKHVPEKNRRALRKAAEKGIRLMLCSGRAFEVQLEYADEIGVDFLFSSANGARIDASRDGGILRETPLETETARQIFRMLRNRGMYFMAYTRGRSYMYNIDEQKRLKKHHHAPGRHVYSGREYEIVADPERIAAECWKGTYKFICFGEDYDPRFEEIRRDLARFDLSLSSSWRDNLEIMHPQADKGAAVRFAAEHLGVAPEQVMVFGDNSNDLPMFRYAGWPVAMGNEEKCALDLARIVAPDNDSGGVGAVIEKYVLGEE